MRSLMKAVRITGRQNLELVELNKPILRTGELALVRVEYVALNHLDCYGYRGMAFVHRKLPLTIGAEAVGIVEQVGSAKFAHLLEKRVVIYPSLVCGDCQRCDEGLENLCERPGGIMGFHVDGLACEWVVVPARQLIEVPESVPALSAACAAITFGTVEHMLFANARLAPRETILVHAGGSGIGSAAILLATAAGASVIATVGSEEKGRRALRIGAEHVINYREQRFERVVRKLTNRRGVDVVFEHVGVSTWEGSLLSLRKGGRLVTCGSTSGVKASTNLFLLFNQQLRIIASFGATYRDIYRGLEKMGSGQIAPVVDSIIEPSEVGDAISRMLARNVFGKIIVRITGP